MVRPVFKTQSAQRSEVWNDVMGRKSDYYAQDDQQCEPRYPS